LKDESELNNYSLRIFLPNSFISQDIKYFTRCSNH